MTAARELDSALFEMAVGNLRLQPLSFADKAAAIAHQTRGRLLFDIRLDGDLRCQRLAAIRYPSGEIGVLLLSRSGLSLATCIVDGAFADLTGPLEHWAGLSLPDQARTDIQHHAVRFVAALRHAGSVPR